MGGRCQACYSWRQRHRNSVERPSSLCQKGLGWCDCGKRAVYKKTVRVGGASDIRDSKTRLETLLLCKDCLELELEIDAPSY